MMNAWKNAVMHVVYALLGNPASTGQLWMAAFVASAVFVIVFTWLSRLLSYPLSSMTLSLCVMALVILVSLSLGAVADMHLGHVELLSKHGLVEWIPLVAVLLGAVAIVAPAQRFITRSRYGPSLAGLLLSLLAAAAIIILLDALVSAFRSGDRDFLKTRDRTRSVNRFLGN